MKNVEEELHRDVTALPPGTEGSPERGEGGTCVSIYRKEFQKNRGVIRLRQGGLFLRACLPSSSVAVQAALLQEGAIALGEERVDADPQEREDGGQEDGPDDDDRRRPVLPPHQTLEERVQVDDHPEREEELPEQGPPRLVPVVDRIGDPSHDPDEVQQEQCRRGDQEGRPLEGVQLRELLVVPSL
jgi:hypothetical protein